MTGIANEYKFNSPLDYKLSGININQEDLPWWAYGILTWLGMVSSIGGCPGEQGEAHRAGLRHIIERGRPEQVYHAYESYLLYYEAYVKGSAK